MPEKILYKELSYQINGLLFRTHNELGRYAREKQYADVFEKHLKATGIPYEREAAIQHPQLPLRSNIADFIIDDKILIELKSKPRFFRDDFDQTLRYLQCGRIKLGILVNFRAANLVPRRIINAKEPE